MDLIYEVYPIGNFKFVWSPNIDDLLNMNIDMVKVPNNPSQEEFNELKFTDKSLIDALKSRNEITIKCNEYHAIFLLEDI